MKKTLTSYTKNPVYQSGDKSILSEERWIWSFEGIREMYVAFV